MEVMPSQAVLMGYVKTTFPLCANIACDTIQHLRICKYLFHVHIF